MLMKPVHTDGHTHRHQNIHLHAQKQSLGDFPTIANQTYCLVPFGYHMILRIRIKKIRILESNPNRLRF